MVMSLAPGLLGTAVLAGEEGSGPGLTGETGASAVLAEAVGGGNTIN